MAERFITLTGKQSQLLLEISDCVTLLHWGKPLHTQFARSLSRAVPYGRLDVDVPVTLFPEASRGSFGSPALEGHRDGCDWSPKFKVVDVNQLNAQQLEITATDPIAQLELVISLKLDKECDVLQLQQRLINRGRERYWVNRLANTLALPDRAAECLSFYGRWVKEFQQQRHDLKLGGYVQENRRGRTSHEHYPALIVGSKHFNESQGEVWGAHLAWSGNHRMRVEVKADGRRYLQAEEIYHPGEVALEANESIATPWLYATYSANGLNAMSQQFHRFVREQILNFPTSKPRPVHLNTWEGIYFDHDPLYIQAMATEAAAMGVERFIIDDGWFRGRNNDRAGLGDWFIDEQKYPLGLMPIIEHVLSLGMEFGIWVEPEMVNKDSDLYRNHPDWLLELPDYQQPTGRNQYLIDLQNPEVFAYLFERLDWLLSKHPISYLKWDMNRETVQPGHQGRAAQHRQIESVYRLIDELRTKHPQVEIEACAAGGGRIDFEVLKRTHRFWISDNNDALERQQIQRGFSYFYPTEVMGAHIGAKHCHSTRRIHDIQFRGLTALFGHYGVELDPVKVDAEERAEFSRYIALHKAHRELIHNGILYRIEGDDSAQLITQMVATDKNQALVLIAQMAMPTYALSGVLRLQGLDAQAHYRVEVIDHPKNFHQGLVNTQPEWTKHGITLRGEWLEEVGLAMPALDPATALLLNITKIAVPTV